MQQKKEKTMENKLIEELKEDGADSKESMLYALQDGEYLAKKTWTQEAIEEAYASIKAKLDA